ncbi:MAG: DNA repair protein RecN [Bacteroidales bacterium]|nr:DNA repair protein RecN [Bacteroidales bacterium]
MFTHLSIRNYVLIQELEIDFHKDLSIITGETGAGKSILLGALGLLTGQRADSGALLDTSKKCIVEGIFDLHTAVWKDYFVTRELEYEPETVIRREIAADGKSRAFINDSPVNLSILKELGAQLVDIHSQHQNIYLQSPAFQLEILDAYAQQTDKVAMHVRAYARYRKFQAELEELQAAAGQQRAELDYHRFRHDELEAAKLQDGEQEALEEELDTLTHAGEIKTGLAQVNALLDADELSVAQMLKSALSTLSKLQGIYHPAENFKQRVESSLIELRDIAAETDRIAETMEHNPDRLGEVGARLDLLYSLQQKHRVSSVKELMTIRDELDAKIREINDYDTRIGQVQAVIAQNLEQLENMAAAISGKRQQAIPDIEERILALLVQLGIPNAIFKVELSPAGQFTPTGTDTVCFLFSANRQQNLQELGKVASGGEISRLMLSIKAAIAEKIALPTLIFDEIDTGVSGEIAGKMGSILERMANFAQIINITHLPQVAAKGRHHYKVYKEDHGAITRTGVRELTDNERILEIAGMLSGEKVTEAAMANARHLLGKA